MPMRHARSVSRRMTALEEGWLLEELERRFGYGVYTQLQRRGADQCIYAIAVALEYALQLFPIRSGNLSRMLSRADHVKLAVEHDQVMVVRTLGFDSRVPVQRHARQVSRGVWTRMGSPARLTTPNTGAGTQIANWATACLSPATPSTLRPKPWARAASV
jgi:hypothetical protein